MTKNSGKMSNKEFNAEIKIMSEGLDKMEEESRRNQQAGVEPERKMRNLTQAVLDEMLGKTGKKSGGWAK